MSQVNVAATMAVVLAYGTWQVDLCSRVGWKIDDLSPAVECLLGASFVQVWFHSNSIWSLSCAYLIKILATTGPNWLSNWI